MGSWFYYVVGGGIVAGFFSALYWCTHRGGDDAEVDDETVEAYRANEHEVLAKVPTYGTMPNSAPVSASHSNRRLLDDVRPSTTYSSKNSLNEHRTRADYTRLEEKSTDRRMFSGQLVPGYEDHCVDGAKLMVSRKVLSEQLSLLEPYFKEFVELLPDTCADIVLGGPPDEVYRSLHKQFLSIVKLGRQGDDVNEEYCRRSLAFFNQFVYDFFAAFTDWLDAKEKFAVKLIVDSGPYDRVTSKANALDNGGLYTRECINELIACLEKNYRSYIDYSVEFLRQIKIMASVITLCLNWFQVLCSTSPEEKEEDLIMQLTGGENFHSELIDLTLSGGAVIAKELDILSKLWWRLAAHYENKQKSLPFVYVKIWFITPLEFPALEMFSSFKIFYSNLECSITAQKETLSKALISNLYNSTLLQTCAQVRRASFDGRPLRKLFLLEYLVHEGGRWEDLKGKTLDELTSLREAKLEKEKTMDSGSSSEKKQVASAFYSSASSTHAPTDEQDEKLGGSQFQGHF